MRNNGTAIFIFVALLIFVMIGCGSKSFKCAKSGCNNNKTLDSPYCAWHDYTSKNSSKSYSSNTKKSADKSNTYGNYSTKKYTSNSSSSNGKSIDVDDVDIETFYNDNIDEFEDIDDAWDYLDDDLDKAEFYD